MKNKSVAFILAFLLSCLCVCDADSKDLSGVGHPSFYASVEREKFNGGPYTIRYEVETAVPSKAKAYIYLMVQSEYELDEKSTNGLLKGRFKAGSAMKANVAGKDVVYSSELPVFKIQLQQISPYLFEGATTFRIEREGEGTFAAWLEVEEDGRTRLVEYQSNTMDGCQKDMIPSVLGGRFSHYARQFCFINVGESTKKTL